MIQKIQNNKNEITAKINKSQKLVKKTLLSRSILQHFNKKI